MAATLDELANTRIPTTDGERELCAFVAWPDATPEGAPLPVLLMIHEFFGLTESITAKARLFANELDCLVIAPDTYRGTSTSFIPQAIYFALTTPQERVNQDLDDALRWAVRAGANTKRVAVLGFCYGGGKAIRYTTQVRPTAATMIFYGKPITDAAELANLRAPVCAVYGVDDNQFPQSTVTQFREALEAAEVEHEVVSYYGAGHAFWKDVAQVENEEMPVIAAYRLATAFLSGFYAGKESFAKKREFLEFQLREQERERREGGGEAVGEEEEDP